MLQTVDRNTDILPFMIEVFQKDPLILTEGHFIHYKLQDFSERTVFILQKGWRSFRYALNNVCKIFRKPVFSIYISVITLVNIKTAYVMVIRVKKIDTKKFPASNLSRKAPWLSISGSFSFRKSRNN